MMGSNHWALTVARAKIHPSGHSPLTIRSQPAHPANPAVFTSCGAVRGRPFSSLGPAI
jgi:hypothetical protein